MFNLGDVVWIADARNGQTYVKCPACLGKRFLTVIFGDESVATVDCSECGKGYEGPSGTVLSYEPRPHTEVCVVRGVEQINDESGAQFRYSLSGYKSGTDLEVFATKEEADAKANELTAHNVERESRRMQEKEKPQKSWAWHATYHRGCAKRAEKDLEYHRSKLVVALTHKKTEAK